MTLPSHEGLYVHLDLDADGFMIFQHIYHVIVVSTITNYEAPITSNQQITSQPNGHSHLTEPEILRWVNFFYSVYAAPLSHITTTNVLLTLSPLSDLPIMVENSSFIASSQTHSNKSLCVANLCVVVNCSR